MKSTKKAAIIFYRNVSNFIVRLCLNTTVQLHVRKFDIVSNAASVPEEFERLVTQVH